MTSETDARASAPTAALTRLETGKQLADFLDGFETLRYDHPEPTNDHDAELIRRFVQLIRESDEYEVELRVSYMRELNSVMSLLALDGINVLVARRKVRVNPGPIPFAVEEPVFLSEAFVDLRRGTAKEAPSSGTKAIEVDTDTNRETGGRQAKVGMSLQEIVTLVNRYIGVSGGYLGDFSYRTHAEFYPGYGDLDIDPLELSGMTTRERYIQILKNLNPADQAKLIRGTVERFPVEAENGPATRTNELWEKYVAIAMRLEKAPGTRKSVRVVVPDGTGEVVKLALADAYDAANPVSSVDRVHTALHGHLQALCDAAQIQYQHDAPMTVLLKELRESQTQLQGRGPSAAPVARVLNSCAAILDALNPIRNQASVAHPNKELIDKEEAMFVLDVAASLFNYLEARLR